MTQDGWTAVDDYIGDRLVPHDAALDAALRASDQAGLPAISVSPSQGKLLHLLAVATGARRVLEIGTLGGYSTIWLARALPPGGRLITLEADPAHAAVARANLARAGLDGVVDVRVGPALDSLPGLAGEAPFDLVFVDADKANNAAYLDWSVRLSRPGTLIVIDNVVREGRVADPGSADPGVVGTRALFDALAADRRLTATAVQTVGSKGWDGFVLALVTGAAPPRSRDQ